MRDNAMKVHLVKKDKLYFCGKARYWNFQDTKNPFEVTCAMCASAYAAHTGQAQKPKNTKNRYSDHVENHWTFRERVEELKKEVVALKTERDVLKRRLYIKRRKDEKARLS